MLGVRTFSPPSAPPLALKKLPFLPYSFSNYSSLSLSLSGRTGFCLFAQKKKKIDYFDEIKLEEIEKFEVIEDGFEFDDDDDDEEFEEDNDELMVPVHKMNEWLEKKPKGFGEGKEYDASLEDKILEEIAQSLKTHIEKFDKLKKEASEGVPSGIRVCINNLPQKKNIYKDLMAAFEGVPGITNISPVNFENKKTRDARCKGFAFVDFKTLKDANRFVQMFSGKSIAFGKFEKPIKCEVLKPLDASSEGLSYVEYNRSSEGSFTFLVEGEDEDEDEDEDDGIEQKDAHLQKKGFNELVKGPDGKYSLDKSEDSSLNKRLKRIEMIEAKLLARASLYEDEMNASKKKPEDKNKPDRKPSQRMNKKPNLKTDKKQKQRIPGSAKK
ncbi:uncharacterized protein LOC130823164 isoform X2 [Amaranthus tricolor]|uniref:uncharacterized protein LOC130823164 isoform X2 n=1 Tax=Amaranthus tricolor TaxID=29722 RepID=UPI0025828637|nr:uncharacterized protein LOC130823164 isoform X2 [Amaranthus tricolor]